MIITAVLVIGVAEQPAGGFPSLMAGSDLIIAARVEAVHGVPWPGQPIAASAYLITFAASSTIAGEPIAMATDRSAAAVWGVPDASALRAEPLGVGIAFVRRITPTLCEALVPGLPAGVDDVFLLAGATGFWSQTPRASLDTPFTEIPVSDERHPMAGRLGAVRDVEDLRARLTPRHRLS
ncbi:hypothetical protein [Miltoncostaea oceani]|uniref:hypothetical protein n=1 Tax=Miltoncostaea oceani TaxID=2843216 RepID=UPI001C3E4BFD|nr:hypothetical protein [Miltoncostaea oceani]